MAQGRSEGERAFESTLRAGGVVSFPQLQARQPSQPLGRPIIEGAGSGVVRCLVAKLTRYVRSHCHSSQQPVTMFSMSKA